MSTIYTANAKAITPSSKSFAILSYIELARGATKYDCVIKILKRIGTRKQLRGYYCGAFRGWVDNGVLTYNKNTKKYHLTAYGLRLLKNAALK